MSRYSDAHRQVRIARGKASHHRCVDCGGLADEWSYDGADDLELTQISNGRTLRFSENVEHYDPRCRSCHSQFDRPLRRSGPVGASGSAKCGTYAGAQWHQKRGQKPCLRCRLARNAYVREWRAKRRVSSLGLQ